MIDIPQSVTSVNGMTGDVVIIGGGGIADPGSNGILARTALNTTSARTITGTTNQITVTNGNGVSGNPTLSLPQDIHTGASPTFAGLSLNNATPTSWSAPLSILTPNLSTSGAGTKLQIGKANTTNNAGEIYFTWSADGSSSNSIVAQVTGGSAYLKIFANSFMTKGNFFASDDSTYEMGASTRYWSNTYTDRLYLNSTAYLDGGTAGVAALTGLLKVNTQQAIYVPDQTNFTGSMFFGTGGANLSHVSGTEGFRNTGVGIDALNANTTGANNVGIGRALTNNTTGDSNMAVGSYAMASNTTGGNNVAMGVYALSLNVSGWNNVAVGTSALYNNTGYYNTAIGRDAGFNKTSGDSNVFIGYQAGYNETGSNKLYISNSNTATPLIGGDFSAVTLITPASIEITDTAKGIILKSPDGTRYRVTVANGGTIAVAAA